MRSVLDTALTVAAIAASLFAVAVVIVLVWWVRSLGPAPAPEAALPDVPAPAARQAAAPVHSVPAPPRPAAPPVQRAAAPVVPAPTAIPTSGSATRGGNDDAAKNRALGAALSRLGEDPELQRQLREKGVQVPP